MPRPAKIWFHKHKKFWCTKLGGTLHYLVKGRKNRDAAQTEFDRLRDEVKLLGDGTHRSLTVAALVEMFLEFVRENRKPRTYEMYKPGLQRFVDAYGGLRAHAIMAHQVDSWTASRKKAGWNETTVALGLEPVLACWNWAVRKGILPSHQLRNIEKPKKRQRDRYLTDEEFQGLLRAANAKKVPRFKPAKQRRPSRAAVFRQLLIAGDQTAARPGELSSLQWDHVDWDRKVWILPDHKTRTTQKTPRPRLIPMTSIVEKLLRWRQTHCPPSPYVFTDSRGNPWSTNSLRCRMRRLREKAGLGKDVVMYTIRHRRATRLVMDTGDLKSTSLLLGHQTVATTERYVHLAADHLVRFARKAIGTHPRAERPSAVGAKAS